MDALQAMKAQGKPAPRFVAVDQAGAWFVPVLYFDDDRRTQERYGLAQELGGGYDEATLARVLADLAVDQGLTGTGWDADDVDDLRRVAAEAGGPEDPGPQLDRAAELQKQWKTARGQLWEIGKHRLLCGDATRADDVADGGHSTQKPLECMARPIRNHDIDAVYDPFLGSGTTLVAAEQLRRVGYAIDIDPGYVAVALARLQGLGLTPRLVK